MTLEVREYGQGSPMVVLPSMGLTFEPITGVFEPVLRSVSTCRRIYVALPGTEGSAPTEPSSEAVLRAVIETLDGLLADASFLAAGWSYGGYLAAALARRLGPRVRGLFVVCAGPKIRPEDRDLSGTLPSAGEPGWLDGFPVQMHDYFRWAVGTQTREVVGRINALLATTGLRDQGFLERLRSDGFALDDEDATFVYEGPTTFLCGRRDRVAGYAATVGALPHYTDADLTLLAQAGHFLPLEAPDGFAGSLGAWVRRCGLRLRTGAADGGDAP